jgi:hypothetical protein
MRALAVGAVLVAILAGFVAFLSPATRGAKSATCGVERWNVKTLQDAAASEVDFANPNTKFVEFLRRLNEKGNPSSGKPPKNLTKTTPRMPPVETTVYKLKALLMSMRREDDKDIHLVIADPKIGGSMIVEFPHESCTTEADPARRAKMQAAVEALATACDGLPNLGSETVFTLKGKATITGVGFFDLVHGQGGVATNGIELHPVLSFTAASCSRVFNP